jgi:ribosomal protein S18 acetylase RimI-like enzyme
MIGATTDMELTGGSDAARIEEAGLNALQTQRQLFFDGWLLRLSPGSAKRARSVNPHFGSSLPVDAKIDRCETIYAAAGLPALFRITPFRKPTDLDDVLHRRGYVAFGRTLVQVMRLEALREAPVAGASIEPVPVAQFVDAVAAMRTSSTVQRDAHLERLANTPLATHAVVARIGERTVACGQVALDGALAGVYDMVTVADFRGRGLATAIVTALSNRAVECGASHAFLQVNDDNAAAFTVYRKFGFHTRDTYHYRARPTECH